MFWTRVLDQGSGPGFWIRVLDQGSGPGFWTRVLDQGSDWTRVLRRLCVPGRGLNDSPVGLAAYILEKFSTWTDKSFKNLEDGGLTR